MLVTVLFPIALTQVIRAQIASNEATAIADIRTVMAAELTVASANCGYFIDIVNLCRSGDECGGIPIPGYDGPDFLGPDLARTSPYRKDGYQRSWVSPWPAVKLPSTCAPRSVLDYCYLADPVEPGRTGARHFGGQASGAIGVQLHGPHSCPITSCVAEGALVATPSGSVPIESLRVGDEALGADAGIGIVVSTRRDTVGNHLRLTFENKTILDITDVHPISTPDGWRAAGTLRPGDVVHALDGVTVLGRVDVLSREVIVYDLTVEPTATFFANGILVHNKSIE